MVPINEYTNNDYHPYVTMFGSSHMINSDQSLVKLRLAGDITGSVTEHAQKLGAWAGWLATVQFFVDTILLFN